MAPRRVRPDPQGPPGGKKRFCVPSLTQAKPMRSADGTKRAAGQRPEHWASHVSLGSKPQRRCLPPQDHSQEEWAPLRSPAGGHRGTSSKALFMCGAWPKDFLLPRNRLAQQSSLFGVGVELGALTPPLVTAA